MEKSKSVNMREKKGVRPSNACHHPGHSCLPETMGFQLLSSRKENRHISVPGNAVIVGTTAFKFTYQASAHHFPAQPSSSDTRGLRSNGAGTRKHCQEAGRVNGGGVTTGTFPLRISRNQGDRVEGPD